MTTSTTIAASKLADPKLLDKIDKLFALNIGEYVGLPQLVVVGDQSSGKSSVLEGLTGLPFPRDSGLCTRFATQITFRRSAATSVAVTVIPAADAETAYAEGLRAWKANLTSLDRDAFGDVVKKVHQLMGLDQTDIKKTFSADVLKIDIFGPEQEHFSVIDVPGIFKKTTAGVTTKEDMEMVRAMILSYMKNERSVILAVIPANVDIATQEILELAEECDRSGQRTLGVLTKPDLVDKGAEQAVVDIVEGVTHSLKLGWCVIRNAGQQQLTTAATNRNQVEQLFFKTQEPWSKLSKDRVGIDALRSRLVEILAEMVQREFLKVRSEIVSKFRTKKKEYANLGPSRVTRDQQHRYVLNLATRFQTIVAFALKADYGDDDLFEARPSLKIATAVVNRNAAFSDDMSQRGHTRAFKEKVEEKALPTNGTKPENPGFGTRSETPVFGRPGTPAFGTKPENPSSSGGSVKVLKYCRQHESFHSELEDILVESIPILEPDSEPIMPWLTAVYKSSRGFELGTFDASLLPIVWKKQSINWEPLALGYVSDIVDLVHTFTMDLLAALCDDVRVSRELANVLLDGLSQRYRRAMNHARFVLRVERDGIPLTTNHYFAENLQKSRHERVRARLEENAYLSQKNERVVKIDATIATSNISNLQHTIGDLHDILHSYYKVARKRFVDVICMQAVDYHLVTGPDTPVKVFTPEFVSELSDEQLKRIAGEDTAVQRRRAQLKRDIDNLSQGMKILN